MCYVCFDSTGDADDDASDDDDDDDSTGNADDDASDDIHASPAPARVDHPLRACAYVHV